uniref:Protein-tyrosine phosphatase receptor IA-2 ectodomain domain-containing protein n=1 Tax=Eptatretus burgeri TaxID=7764 RepID=A0A8C4QV78_EPTBU
MMVRPRHELRALLVLVVLTVQAPVSAPLDCENGQCERIDGPHSADLSSLLLRRERPDAHINPGVLSGRLWPGRGGEQFWLSHNTYRAQPFLPLRRAAIFQWLDSRKGHRPTSNSAEHSLDQPGLDMTISRGRLEQHSLDRGTHRGRSMNKPSGRNLFSKVLPLEVQQRGERRMLKDKTHAPSKGSLLDLLLQGIGERTRGDARGEEQEVGRWEGAKAGSENVHSVSENRALPGLQKSNLPQKNTALSIPPAIGEEVHVSRHAPSSALVEVGRGYGGEKREGFMVKNRDSGLRSVKKTEQAMQSSELEKRDSDYGYIITDKTPLRLHEAWQLLGALGHAAGLSYTSFTDVSVTESVITFRIQQNPLNLSLADIADHAVLWRTSLHRATGIRILQVGVGQHAITMGLAQPGHRDGGIRPALILALCVLLALAVVSGTAVVFFTRSRASWKRRADYTSLDTEPGTDPPADYQELCRQRMASQSSEPERDRAPSVPHVSRISSLSSQPSEGAPYPHSPSPRSSISSWTEEPATSNLDITTGHMILVCASIHLH